MERIRSQLNSQSAAFRKNDAHHRGLAQELQARCSTARKGGSEQAVALLKKRGKLTVRERLDALLDPQTPFLELSSLAAYGLHDNKVPAAGIVTGIGMVSGRKVMVVANDPTVKGGTYFPETVKKHVRAQEIAHENRLPCIYLVDSGGAYLPLQAEVFPDKDHFGRIFYNQATMSAAGIPQIAVVLGMCTAGGAYVPAMADENIIVAGQGTIYLAGPPLVKAATGEDVDAETLGGGAMHARVSGVVDHLAVDEAHALRLCRNAVAHLGMGGLVESGMQCVRRSIEEPHYDPEEIYGVLPADHRQPVDAHELLARLLDGSRFHAFKPEYGQTLVCGFGHWMGYPVGIVANNGVLFPESALKGAHFIQMCEQRRVPLIFLQNITGFMVGSQMEHAGIAKAGAKMVQAVATATVPKLTVLVGASHGAGTYAMCGRGYLPRFLFAWPNARVSVMGADQAAEVLVQVQQQKCARQNETLSAEEAEAIAAPTRKKYNEEGQIYYGTARLWDDGILDPKDTRAAVGLALSAAMDAPMADPAAPVFRM